MEIDYGFFRVFGPYFIGKSQGTFKILIFGLWSFIPPPSMIAFHFVGGGSNISEG